VVVRLDEAQGAGRELQDGDGESLALLPGYVQHRVDLADRPEEEQRQVEPVHAGVVQQAAAVTGRGVPPVAKGRPHAQAQPDQHRPADAAGVDEPLGFGVRRVEDLVMGHPEGHASRRRGVDEFLALVNAGRQGLFHEHVLARPDRLKRHGKVQVVRQADGHGADLGVGDQLTGVPVGPHTVGRERLEQFRRGVGHGYQPRGRRPPDGVGVYLAGLAEAYQPHRASNPRRMRPWPDHATYPTLARCQAH
jgi:hypothetical protein